MYLVTRCFSFFISCNPVPSSPRNLTLQIESNTTMSVSWSPPEYENGIIIEYGIHVKEQGINSRGRILNVSGETNYTLVKMLKPYTNYTFRLRARTSAGWGNFSERQIARTDEGCTLSLFNEIFILSFSVNSFT